jgi:hypothetical protein
MFVARGSGGRQPFNATYPADPLAEGGREMALWLLRRKKDGTSPRRGATPNPPSVTPSLAEQDQQSLEEWRRGVKPVPFEDIQAEAQRSGGDV